MSSTRDLVSQAQGGDFEDVRSGEAGKRHDGRRNVAAAAIDGPDVVGPRHAAVWREEKRKAPPPTIER